MYDWKATINVLSFTEQLQEAEQCAKQNKNEAEQFKSKS